VNTVLRSWRLAENERTRATARDAPPPARASRRHQPVGLLRLRAPPVALPDRRRGAERAAHRREPARGGQPAAGGRLRLLGRRLHGRAARADGRHRAPFRGARPRAAVRPARDAVGDVRAAAARRPRPARGVGVLGQRVVQGDAVRVPAAGRGGALRHADRPRAPRDRGAAGLPRARARPRPGDGARAAHAAGRRLHWELPRADRPRRVPAPARRPAGRPHPLLRALPASTRGSWRTRWGASSGGTASS
jgi:hypothetical protein